MSCMYYINHQRQAKSPFLWSKPMRLQNWHIQNQISISAAYLLDVQKHHCRYLQQTDLSESQMWDRSHYTTPLISMLGHPEDRSVHHIQNLEVLPVLLEEGAGPSLLGRCLSSLLTSGLLYVFPPTPLISRVLIKIRIDKARVIQVVLTWPRKTYFHYLIQ